MHNKSKLNLLIFESLLFLITCPFLIINSFSLLSICLVIINGLFCLGLLFYQRHLFPILKIELRLVTVGLCLWLIGNAFLSFNRIFSQSLQFVQPLASIISVLFLITATFLVIALIIKQLITNIKLWYGYQLVLDIIASSIIMYIVFKPFIFDTIPYSDLSSVQVFSSYVLILSNLIALQIIFILFQGSSLRHLTLTWFSLLLGSTLYLTANLSHFVHILSDTKLPSSFVYILFLISFHLFALAFWYGQKDGSFPLTKLKSFNADNEQGDIVTYYQQTKNLPPIFYLPILPTFLYFYGVLTDKDMLITLSIIIIYSLADRYLRKTAVTEILLSHEQKLNLRLETAIASRTEALEKLNQELLRQSRTDFLTSLHNRQYFIEIIQQATKEDKPFCLVYVDLDRFKVINDLHGHQVGDELLIELARRLQQTSHQDCHYARIGGDEFGIICYADGKDLNSLANDLLTLFQQPIHYHQFRFELAVSLGIARYPKDTTNAEELMRFADFSIAQAKKNQLKKKSVVYHAAFVEKSKREYQIEWALKNLRFQDLSIVFQPIFTTQGQKIVGFETLLRWHHPELGDIPPSEFIPISERTGDIVPITDWVFDQAAQTIKHLNQTHRSNLYASVNVSPVSFDTLDFFPNLLSLFAKYQLNPSWLCIEVTEHSAMSSAIQMEEIFSGLCNTGVKISIDDFGTGYSSLSSLKRFDIDELKIDKSLIDNIANNHNDLQIIEAIITMANQMGLTTVAEGVESEEQTLILETLPCTYIQGFLWSKPLDLASLEELLINQNAL